MTALNKALAENAVGLVYQRIYAPLRNRKFYSLQELNEAIWDKLDEHNNKRFQRFPVSRRELYERIERRALKPLPAEVFAMKTPQMATVEYNYHVELIDDHHYYSVPWSLRTREPKTRVKLLYDERLVSIYYDNVRIVVYNRDRTPNGYTTLNEHRPSEHRWYAEWSPERFKRWAKALGDEVEEVIIQVIESRKYPEQAFKTCMGILNLEKKYGVQRLNKACRRAISLGLYSYKRIENILKRKLDGEDQPELDLKESQLPEHENVRGGGYYH